MDFYCYKIKTDMVAVHITFKSAINKQFLNYWLGKIPSRKKCVLKKRLTFQYDW